MKKQLPILLSIIVGIAFVGFGSKPAQAALCFKQKKTQRACQYMVVCKSPIDGKFSPYPCKPGTAQEQVTLRNTCKVASDLVGEPAQCSPGCKGSEITTDTYDVTGCCTKTKERACRAK